jgi:hypothetical protein
MPRSVPAGRTCFRPCGQLRLAAHHRDDRKIVLQIHLQRNTGATSYHLRQLADAGLVLEDDSRGNARDRWWQAAHRGTYFDQNELMETEPELTQSFLHGIGQIYAENIFRGIDELQTRTPEHRPHRATRRRRRTGLRLDPGAPPGDPVTAAAPGTDQAAPPPGTPYRAPLIAFLVANVVSICGTRVSAIAIPWFVLVTTGSPVKMGLTALAETLPLVLSKAFGGPLIDRLGARRVSVSADTASTLVVALVPLLHALGALNFPTLLVLVGVAGALRGPGDAAKGTLIPDIAEAA